jgi:hypothetical protein
LLRQLPSLSEREVEFIYTKDEDVKNCFLRLSENKDFRFFCGKINMLMDSVEGMILTSESAEDKLAAVYSARILNDISESFYTALEANLKGENTND